MQLQDAIAPAMEKAANCPRCFGHTIFHNAAQRLVKTCGFTAKQEKHHMSVQTACL